MTPAELSILKSMTVWEITRKYLPLKAQGKIDQKQYEYLLSLGKDFAGARRDEDTPKSARAENRAVGMLIREFGGYEVTTHENEKKGLSQKERLLDLLSDGEWHTTVEIQRQVYGVSHGGICRIASRANDLRKEGYKIACEKDTGTVWRYRLLAGKSDALDGRLLSVEAARNE